MKTGGDSMTSQHPINLVVHVLYVYKVYMFIFINVFSPSIRELSEGAEGFLRTNLSVGGRGTLESRTFGVFLVRTMGKF